MNKKNLLKAAVAVFMAAVILTGCQSTPVSPLTTDEPVAAEQAPAPAADSARTTELRSPARKAQEKVAGQDATRGTNRRNTFRY